MKELIAAIILIFIGALFGGIVVGQWIINEISKAIDDLEKHWRK